MKREHNTSVFMTFLLCLGVLVVCQSCGEGASSSVEDTRIKAADTQEGDAFGSSVSISGKVAIVGAPFKGSLQDEDSNEIDGPGGAYIFQLEKGHWIEKQELSILDVKMGDGIGYSVSISGESAIVGAPGGWSNFIGGHDGFHDEPGTAYIFQVENGKWVQKAILSAHNAEANDEFGFSVSISGDLAIVGAPGEDGIEEDSGSAYIFQLENGQWIENAKLTASDPLLFGYFGWSASINGDTAIIGASGADGAYIFQLENGDWVEKQKLIGSDRKFRDLYSRSVSINGEWAIVGASGSNGSGAGTAYFFQFENDQWEERQKLTVSGAEEDDKFGKSVSISGDVAIIGAPGDNLGRGEAFDFAGTAHILRLVNGKWEVRKRLTASDAKGKSFFGRSVSISENLAIVGSSTEAAYLY